MESQELQITPHHAEFLDDYLKFRKLQRSEAMKTVVASFRDAQQGRLFEETYTREEVEDILESILEIVRTDVEGELIHITHTNCVILNSLFHQAQKWHLELNLDLAEAEDEKKLSAVKFFEESELGRKESLRKSHLNPIGENLPAPGPVALLENHIKDLSEENSKLQKELELAKKKIDDISKDFQEHIMNSSREKGIVNISPPPIEQEDLNQLKNKLDIYEKEVSASKTEAELLKRNMSQELSAAKMSLNQVQSQLQLAEEELEKKFSRTGAYLNMQKMLKTKNEHIKVLRQRILTHEPNFELETTEKPL